MTYSSNTIVNNRGLRFLFLGLKRGMHCYNCAATTAVREIEIK